MKTSITHCRLIKLAVAVSLITLSFSPISAQASDHETECFNSVQGKVPWNDEKNMNWDPKNIKQLCAGTTKPAEPGACYLSVLDGRVNWGKGISWDWQNIINLCAGTNNAKNTVDCFEKAVGKGLDWRDAILFCQRAEK
ncbi:hypothetical protein ACH518_11925 [Methylomonas sp. HW2-6]|uniref:hypothetical protein n=1 Tax=Methylomonas sp. HW2-6 TaxID=3376687 RepID=UPI0040433CE9